MLIVKYYYYVSIILDRVLVCSVTIHHILQSNGSVNVVGSIRYVSCSHLGRYERLFITSYILTVPSTQLVKSVCAFSLHFRTQAWNFVRSIIGAQKVKFGSDSKILPSNVHFTDQTTGTIGQKIFSRISLSYSSL